MPDQAIINEEINRAIQNSVDVLKRQKSQHPAFEKEFSVIIATLEKVKNKDAELRESAFEAVDTIVKDRFDASPELGHIKDILDETKARIYRVAPLENWKSKINDYEIGPSSIDHLLTNPAAQNALYADAYPRGSDDTRARTAFLEFLDNRLSELEARTGRPRPTISMTELLGAEGVQLYRAAIEEEGKSRAFREAVFLKSTQHYAGDKWDKKLILWVGGPSASGKTYGASGAVKAMAEHMPKAHDEGYLTIPAGNNVVSVDGGIEREMSQMRQMVLQSALSKGYSAISDLHANTKFNTKEQVKAAALAQDDLSLVIPETFAESALLKRFGSDGAYKVKEMERYHAMPNAIQAFSEIRGVEGQLDHFQTSVYHMGTSRAAFSEDKSFNSDEFKMNNLDIGCESKEYGASGFLIGKFASQQARNNLKAMDPEGTYIAITNDLIFVHRDQNGNWQQSTKTDQPEFRLSARDFKRWEEERNSTEATPDLKEWHASEKANNRLAPQLIQVIPNDLISVHINSLAAKIQISKRDIEAYKAQRNANPETPNLLAWCSARAERGELITPLSIIQSTIKPILARPASAPNLSSNVPDSRPAAVRMSSSTSEESAIKIKTEVVNREEVQEPKPSSPSPGLKKLQK